MKTTKISLIFGVFLCSAVLLPSCAENKGKSADYEAESNTSTVGENFVDEPKNIDNTTAIPENNNTSSNNTSHTANIVGNPLGARGSDYYFQAPWDDAKMKDMKFFNTNTTVGEMQAFNRATNTNKIDLTPTRLKLFDTWGGKQAYTPKEQALASDTYVDDKGDSMPLDFAIQKMQISDNNSSQLENQE